MTNFDISVERRLPLRPAVFQILISIGDEGRHGYAIMQDVAARTNGKVRLSPGTLYGSIRKMLHDGLIGELGRRGRGGRAADGAPAPRAPERTGPAKGMTRCG